MGRERETEADKVERLTKMAESGDKEGLQKELHAMDPFERVGIARQMDDLNAQHRESNKNLPDIQLVTGKDFAGMERLDDMVTKVPNNDKAWYKPWTWFESSDITKDVYDPDFDKYGNGGLQKTLEAVKGRKAQLDEIMKSM